MAWTRCLFIFLLSFVYDFVSAAHLYALSHDNLLTALVFGFFLPFFGMYEITLYLEAKSTRSRFVGATCIGLGVALGTWVTLLTFGASK